MNFVISDGSTQAIIVGSKVKVRPGVLPSQFDDQWIPIVKVDVQGPFAKLEDSLVDEIDWDVNLSSCISSQLITQVI
jgi:hypothetical protein